MQEMDHLAWDKRMPDRKNSMCFERTALPPEEQLSHFPEADEPGVKYFRGILRGRQVLSAQPQASTKFPEQCAAAPLDFEKLLLRAADDLMMYRHAACIHRHCGCRQRSFGDSFRPKGRSELGCLLSITVCAYRVAGGAAAQRDRAVGGVCTMGGSAAERVPK